MLETGKIQKGRRRPAEPDYLSAVLAFILLLYSVPTFVACNKLERQEMTGMETGNQGTESIREMKIKVKAALPPDQMDCLDIFVFNDDENRRLDSYRRIAPVEDDFFIAASRTGNKILVILANTSTDLYSWSQINSWDSLEKTLFQLENETPQKHILVGVYHVDNHPFEYYEVSLDPILARIRLKSLAFNFKEGSLEGLVPENIKCYLTHVCNRYPVAHEGLFHSPSFINQGRLSEEDLHKMKDPSMLYCDWSSLQTEKQDKDTTDETGYSFYCFPNVVDSPSLSKPYTRLVIEAKIGEQTYYYPLNLNMITILEENGQYVAARGVEEGMEYSYDIEITRLGVLDPDTPISVQSMNAKMSVRSWDEKQKEIIDF